MKRNLFSKAWLAVLVLAVTGLMAACVMPSPAPVPNQPQADQTQAVEPAPAGDTGSETITLYVGPNREPCVGVAPQICYQVKDTPDGEYTLFYDEIDGFEYEPGYDYELTVEKTTVPNPPADASAFQYTLVEVVNKTPAAPTATLEGTTWQLIAYLDAAGNLTLPYRESPATLTMADGQAGGNTGCNNYFGSYTLDGDSLTFGPMGATMMACPEPQAMQEQAYLAGLENVASYAIVGNQLHLFNADGEIIMAFEPQQSTSLTGTVWSATMVNNGNQAVTSLVIGTEITAIFGDDGSLTGSAGCNNYTTTYEVDGDSISIGMGASTMMFCAEPEGVMDQEAQYLAALETAATYTISADRLELRTADGALAVSYVAAGEATAATPAETGDDTRAPDAEPVDEATMVALRNMTYTNIAVTDTVTLTNGVYTSTVSPDVPVEIYVESTDYAAAGELDGVPSVATILVSNGGGSGVFYDLAVVQEQDGQPVNVATTLLGDRVSIISLYIVDNQVVVDMITQGPDEPMCCGTLEVVNTYELQGNELVETASESVGTVDQGPTNESIVGVLWEWVETAYSNDTTLSVDDPSKYTMLLNDDGTANFQIDCNMGGGTYELDGSTLRLDVSTMTRVACPEGTLSDVFVRELNAAATFVMDGPDLILNLFADAGNMRFRMSENQPAAAADATAAPELSAQGIVTPTLTQPASAADILNKPWQWVAFTDPINGTQDVANPASYTVQFQSSGIARILADCNHGAGGYTIDGSSISIEIGAMTRAQCAADSQGDTFTQYLGGAATWFVDGEDLYIDLFADAGTMKFSPAS
ncbi:MAG: META domain-containing protein [Anaerolineae bacterium]|nr:META domain-containing protein [Anaerolineae bacterium]